MSVSKNFKMNEDYDMIREKNKLQMLASFLMLIFLFLLTTSSTVFAADEVSSVVGFTYKIDYPAAQSGGQKGYFDLLLDPGKEETLKIQLANPGKETETILVAFNGAKTNSNGVIEYGPTEIANDLSLKFPFETLVDAPEEVELAPGEKKILEFTVKMPETSFEGIILGGIQLKRANQHQKQEEVEGATVRNSFSYLVAVKLQNKETAVKPEIEFNQAIASQRNYKNAVGINLSNVKAVLVKNKLSLESQITKEGSQEVLYERKQAGMSITPNSQMDFFVEMGGEAMVAGKYNARILAKIDDQTWETTLPFTITKEEADKYNKRDVGLVQERGLDWKMVMLIVGSVLGLVVVIFGVVKLIQGSNQGQRKKKKSSTSSSNSARRESN